MTGAEAAEVGLGGAGRCISAAAATGSSATSSQASHELIRHRLVREGGHPGPLSLLPRLSLRGQQGLVGPHQIALELLDSPGCGVHPPGEPDEVLLGSDPPAALPPGPPDRTRRGQHGQDPEEDRPSECLHRLSSMLAPLDRARPGME